MMLAQTTQFVIGGENQNGPRYSNLSHMSKGSKKSIDHTVQQLEQIYNPQMMLSEKKYINN